jgi:hypothetical protein
MPHRLVAFAALVIATLSSLRAQQALTDRLSASGEMSLIQCAPGLSRTFPKGLPVASAWIDLRQNAPANSKAQSAPSWVESVAMVAAQQADGAAKSVFRIRVAKPAADYSVLFFRLFFDDKSDARPELVAWDELGAQVLRSGALGAGLGLTTSDSVMIPMQGISAIDVEVPGDGKTVRGAYLDWMTSTQIVHPVNAEHRDIGPEPFSAPPPLHAPDQDLEQFGTVTATLSPETIKIGPDVQEAADFQFGMEAQPLVALLTFEVATPRIDSPPEVYANGQALGPANLALPDLADPGYRGQMESLVKKMQFEYTGWVRVQKIVPGEALKVGANDIVVIAGAQTPSSAIRNTQLQLKYLWDKSDYQLRAGR